MYTAKDIRNICLLGHGGDGKSALAESMLFLTKAIDRLGKRTDGNTTSDFDPEEIKRANGLPPCKYLMSLIYVFSNTASRAAPSTECSASTVFLFCPLLIFYSTLLRYICTAPVRYLQ